MSTGPRVVLISCKDAVDIRAVPGGITRFAIFPFHLASKSLSPYPVPFLGGHSNL